MNANAQAGLAVDLVDAVEGEMGKVVEFRGKSAPAIADMDTHEDLHRKCVARSDQDQADAKRALRVTLASIKAERKALKDKFAADSAALDERESKAKDDTEVLVDKARRFASKSRAWLAAE